ncbi:MAG: zinc-dependent alcohol dehydrogenase family protein [Pseudomonadota bacterium]
MKAMVLNAYGDNAPFELSDVPKPEATAGHVVVRIAATSVNTVDTMIRRLGQEGLSLSPALPALLGMDFAGTVESVGPGVTDFVPGDEVYGCAGGLADLPGALAEYLRADTRLIARKPASLSMREAAALPLVGITAFEGLRRANVRDDQTVLVHGGTGGVGHVAVQLAQALGAKTYATVSSRDQFAIIESYGAIPINYREDSPQDYVDTHTAGSGFDVVYDSVGGANMTNSFEAAGLNGSVVTTVAMTELDLTVAHFKGLSIHVVFMLIPMLYNHRRSEHGKLLAELAGIVDAGTLAPLLDSSQFSLANVGDAYAHLESGTATGKVVIEL